MYFDIFIITLWNQFSLFDHELIISFHPQSPTIIPLIPNWSFHSHSLTTTSLWFSFSEINAIGHKGILAWANLEHSADQPSPLSLPLSMVSWPNCVNELIAFEQYWVQSTNTAKYNFIDDCPIAMPLSLPLTITCIISLYIKKLESINTIKLISF
jgi:hypothetical protein